MPNFVYEALNAAGKTEKGRIEADNSEAAMAAIRKNGFFPTTVREDKLKEGSGKKSDSKKEKKKSKKKLSFNESHALKSLPGKMSKLEEEIAGHKKTLADPQLYARDPDRFAKTADALQNAEDQLAQMEEEWLMLEMKREEIEGG